MKPLAVRSEPRFRSHTPRANPGGVVARLGLKKAAARMHGGYYAQLGEARNIGQIDGLDVLHAIASTSRRRIRFGQALEPVQRHSNRAVADRVNHNQSASRDLERSA